MQAGNAYAVDTLDARLKRLKADPWARYAAVRQSITRGHLDAVTGEDAD